MMCGSRRGGGAQHEHTSQAMFQNVPGLRVIAPGTPASVDGALHQALTGEDPTILIDHILLAPFEGELAESPADVSAPALLRDGGDALLVSYSLMLQHCLQAARILAEEGLDVAVLEVATLAPLAVAELVEATAGHGNVLFVDESRAAGSPASHMLAQVVQARPSTRTRLVCTLDAPAPFAIQLLDELLPTPARIAAETRALIGA